MPLRYGRFEHFSVAEREPAAIVGAVAGFLASAELMISSFDAGGSGGIGHLQTCSFLPHSSFASVQGHQHWPLQLKMAECKCCWMMTR